MGVYMLLFMIITNSKRLESVHLFSNQEMGEEFLKCLHAYLKKMMKKRPKNIPREKGLLKPR